MNPQHFGSEITAPGSLFHPGTEPDGEELTIETTPVGGGHREEPLHLVLDGDSLEWTDLAAALEAESIIVRIDPQARARMARHRAGAFARLKQDPQARVYGWNQALGPLKDHPLSEVSQRQFQLNVLRSHAVGIGGHLPLPISRLALIIRANVLLRGTTGARPELVDRIVEIVNAGIAPLLPEIGSLGTGDLQPMAAAGLCMIGEAPAALDAEGVKPLTELFAAAGLKEHFQFEAGEAIALISGSAVLSACLADAVRRASQQLSTFIGAVGLFCEATRAQKSAFDRRLHAERRIPEEELGNELILSMFEDSDWMTAEGRLRLGETAPRVQDSTSVRCTSHSVATVLKVLEQTKLELVQEVNASTANPLVLPVEDGAGAAGGGAAGGAGDGGAGAAGAAAGGAAAAEPGHGGYEFVTGGNWDCTMLGHAALSLNVQITNLAVLAKDLTARLGSEAWSYGLPASLVGGPAGLNSGMTLSHAVVAALIPEMHARATPVSSLSFPLKGGQEDHNTMAMAGVHNLVSNLNRFDSVLAVTLLMSAQGISLIEPQMEGLALGRGTQELYCWIRKRITPLRDDRPMGGEIEEMAEYIRTGAICLAPPLTVRTAELEAFQDTAI